MPRTPAERNPAAAGRPRRATHGMRDSAARRVGTAVSVPAGAGNSRADRKRAAHAVAAHGQRRTWRAVLQLLLSARWWRAIPVQVRALSRIAAAWRAHRLDLPSVV